ncbi:MULTISPECIES: DUF3278 domain-containing protein [Vagococcus]|uniref:DUF3278 domain-containing protein n=1 Tax=Vagococcus fluvialis bH819 TaxID=1255619 RepID=A0A1X6WQZ5_9ENTE|nr:MULTISPECIES: DUF3278 domain-containing protein [Vagococcus]SLM86076.1 hypothetical protein FM121_08310 [Vagococcus fluvialis bH819]HCM90326.1 DUF3278 domain-containing protein [Vagococcus sp.]
MEKEKLGVRLIKRVYGISGVLDEYKRAEINRIGNNAFMFLWGYFLVANMIAVIAALNFNPEVVLWVLLITSFLMIIGIGLYMMYEVECAELANDEVEEKDFMVVKKKMKRNAILGGLFFSGIQLIGSDYSIKSIIIYLAVGLFFGSAMYGIGVTNIKKVKND